MEFVDVLRIVLRLIHILSAVIWVGLGATLVYFVSPAARSAGESGLRFMKSMYTHTAINRAIPTAAVITVLAGILLYVVAGSASYFSQLGNMALGTGALFGLLAAGHGGSATGRATKAMHEALNEHVRENGTVTQEGRSVLQERASKLATHSRISFYLMMIALIGMAIARYL